MRSPHVFSQIKSKHKLNSTKQYEAQVKQERAAAALRAEAASLANRPKTPKWMKDFSVDGLIEELTAEREAKMVKEMEIKAGEKAARKAEKEAAAEATAAAAALLPPTSSPPPRPPSPSSSEDSNPPDTGGIAAFISRNLSSTFIDARSILYEHGSATYIQKIYRSRLQRRKFLRNLTLNRYKTCVRALCRSRRRFLAAETIVEWYRARKFYATTVFPIENAFCRYKEYEVVRLLKRWLNLSPPETSDQTLVLTLPKAMYK